MANQVITNGISVPAGPDGPVPIRREIRSLQRDFPDLWTLYLLGLKAFQEADENDILSYYRIAGIHGRPYRPWNDVTGQGPQRSGYCTHASILFPTWHRPYLALFEEVLYQVIQKKATEFPVAEGRGRYVAAAKDFRMPYWDWALVVPRGTNSFPSFFSSRTISIVTPTSQGRPTPIDNPLYSFKFHPVNPVRGDFAGQVATWQQTVRWPLNGTAVSQNNLITEQIELNNNHQDGNTSNVREQTFTILASYTDYAAFSNARWVNRPGSFASLEGVHDTIHVLVGGDGTRPSDVGGNMSQIPYAAFDPIFWLHHTNVDRLFAIWQALNPNSYVTPRRATQPTVTTNVGATESITTGLTPFWESSDSFWTSEGVRKTGTFGYAYPETQPWNFSTPQQYNSNIRATIRQLYGASNLATLIAESSPGNLSDRAQLNVPVQASVVRDLPKPTDQSAGLVALGSSFATLATFDLPPIERVLPQAVQKPLVAQAKHEETKHIENPNPAPQHTAATTAPKDADKAKTEPKHDNKPPPKTEKIIGEPSKHDNKSKSVLKHDDHGTGGHGRHGHQGHPKRRDLTSLAPSGKYLEWYVNIKVQKHCLNGTFGVHVFLGNFNRDDPVSWNSTSNKVGSVNVLGDSLDTGCEKCQEDQANALTVTGQVPLTLALAERYLAGFLDNLSVEAVIPYLQENLHWRISVNDGTEFPRGQVPSLTVSVISNEVTVPTADDELPQYSDEYTIHPECTTSADGTPRGEGTGLTDVAQV